MKLLALDTSSVACSVALQRDKDVFVRHEEQPREHTRLLLPLIRDVLEESGVSLSDLDAIVLGNGPGSFIGMRIASAVAQGLAYGAGCNIIPVSSMATVAMQVFATTSASATVVAQDAHMTEVYLGIYERNGAGLPTELCDERLQKPEPIAELCETEFVRCNAAGFGWRRYPELWSANSQVIGEHSGMDHPRAEYLLPQALSATAVSPDKIEPAYLRQKVAQKPCGQIS